MDPNDRTPNAPDAPTAEPIIPPPPPPLVQGPEYQVAQHNELESTKKMSRKLLLLFVLLILILVPTIVFGYSQYQKNSYKSVPVPIEETVIAKPTPDPTAEWKTYINTIYQYSIKHPVELSAIEASRSGSELGTSTNTLIEGEAQKTSFVDASGASRFEVTIYPNSQSQPIQEWIEEQDARPGSQKSEFRKDLTVGGIQAKQYSMFEFDKQGAIVVANHNNYFYYIHFSENDPNDPEFTKKKLSYDQMLSTFKFTSQGRPAPSANPSGEQGMCTMDAKVCPDGSSVGRVAPSCEFAPCP